jgi:hypothetical protein
VSNLGTCCINFLYFLVKYSTKDFFRPSQHVDESLLENVPRITRQELEETCEDFSNIIGSSSDTVIYKGTMKDGPEIAVVSLCVSRNYWMTSYLEHYFRKEASTLCIVPNMQ